MRAPLQGLSKWFLHIFRLPSSIARAKNGRVIVKGRIILCNHLMCGAEKLAKTFAKRRNHRTLVIYLPIESHQQLNGFHLRIMCQQLIRAVDIFVREVLDGVAQDLQSAAAFRRNVTATARSRSRSNTRTRDFVGGCLKSHITR